MDLRHNRAADSLQLLQLVVVLLFLSQGVRVQPLQGIIAFLTTRALLTVGQFAASFVQSLLHLEYITLQAISRLHPTSLLLVLFFVAFGVVQHSVDLLLGQATFVILDHDILHVTRTTILGRHIEDTIRVQIEGHLDLRYSARSRRYAGQVEFTQQVVVLGHSSFSFEHLYRDRGLVVRVRGEYLGLLARNSAIPFDKLRHHTAGGFDTQRQRRYVDEQHVLDGGARIAAENSGLHGGTVRHRLIRVDGQVQLLTVEEVLQQMLDFGDSRRSAHQNHVVDVALAQLGILQRLLDGGQGRPEQIRAEFLESGSRDLRIEVDTGVQGVDLDVRLRRRGQSSLGSLSSRSQPSQGTVVVCDVFLVFTFELLLQVVDDAVVEVFTTEVTLRTTTLR